MAERRHASARELPPGCGRAGEGGGSRRRRLAGMLLYWCLDAATQIVTQVDGAKSNREALQGLGQKARYVKEYLLEPDAQTIHEGKYSELLQILKAAQILVATRGKRSFLGSMYDAVLRATKVKAEIDNVKEQLKDWLDFNAPSRRTAPAPAPASAPAPAPTGEQLT